MNPLPFLHIWLPSDRPKNVDLLKILNPKNVHPKYFTSIIVSSNLTSKCHMSTLSLICPRRVCTSFTNNKNVETVGVKMNIFLDWFKKNYIDNLYKTLMFAFEILLIECWLEHCGARNISFLTLCRATGWCIGASFIRNFHVILVQ